MNRTIRIAVGSTRKPKVAAVQEALAQVGALLAPEAQIEVLGLEADSGVSHTPVSREELMRGARQRVQALSRLGRDRNESWDYLVGMEGGFDVIKENGSRRVFLESWAFVSNGHEGYYGRSGGVEVPATLAHEVLDNGVELSLAIDRFAGAVGVRDAQGAWGVLSADLISRTEAFRIAVIAAFAPFYNIKMYREAAVVGHS